MNIIEKITINEWNTHRDDFILIDVRSPKEFDEFRIPGAINVPIFTNEERAKVGTLFKQKGEEEAKDLGITFVSKKLPNIYTTIKEYAKTGKRVVIYCFRGGMRSRSLVTVMRMMGVACEQLEGGIRSFRKKIVSELEDFAKMDKPFLVVEGCTGSRKTDLLNILENKNYPVIDLEGLADHRGSIFGGVGLHPQSQKQFECDLWERLNKLKDEHYYIIEGESKRIGNVILPAFIIKGKEKGDHLYIEYPFEKRINAIKETYNPELHRDAINEAFNHLKKYLTPQFKEELEDAFQHEDYHTFIGLLLEHYYDPKYLHKISSYRTTAETMVMETLESGVQQVEQFLKRKYVLTHS